jgi:hypothetical protein
VADVIDHPRKHATSARRVRPMAHGGRIIARVDLTSPVAAQALGEVAADWLYRSCSEDGKRKLLEQHNLLAA